MSLYLRVKELAEKQRMSIRALEIACGFGNGTIKKWETQSPSFDKIITLADKLNISLHYLATGRTEETASLQLTPGEQAIYEQVHPLSEADKFKLAGALPFIRMMQDAPYIAAAPERERAAVSLFTGSTSRD